MAPEYAASGFSRVTPDDDRRSAAADRMVEESQRLALRLAIGAAGLTIALGLYARSQDLLRTDEPFRESSGRAFWFLAFVAAVGFGIVVARVTDRGESRNVSNVAASAAILPGLVLFSAFQFLAWDSRTAIVSSAPLLAGAGVFTAVIVRHYLLSGDDTVYPGARLIHSVLTAGVSFLALSLARGWMDGWVFTLVAVFVLSGLLLYQAFDGIRAFPVRRIAYAVAGAIVVSELALALRYWPPTGWYGGAILTTVFVTLMLVSEAILTRKVSIERIVRNIGAGTFLCVLLGFLAR